MIIVVDYGMGNLRSVSKALEHLGAEVCVTSDPQVVEQADKLILPGVGAFGAAMGELAHRRLIEPVNTAIRKGIPYLGICLGLQLLFDHSMEHRADERDIPGLALLRGVVKPFPTIDRMEPSGESFVLKVPHMGWNNVAYPITDNTEAGCPLFKGIPNGSYFYFVHSYYVELENSDDALAWTEYGRRFCSIARRGNVWGAQFHPEKSQNAGMQLLRNFLGLEAARGHRA